MVLLSLLSAALAQTPMGAAAEAFFEAKIRPVLVESCLKCHGPKKASNGLRLDSRAALLEGGERGPAILPGKAEKSLLVDALRHRDPKLRMPPDKKLPDHVVADFAAWIKGGAVWPKNEPSTTPVADKH